MTAPLPIWVLKNGMPVRRTKSESGSTRRGRLAAAPSMISGRLRAEDHLGGPVERRRRGDRQLDRMRRDQRNVARSSAAMSSGSSRCTGPGRSSSRPGMRPAPWPG